MNVAVAKAEVLAAVDPVVVDPVAAADAAEVAVRELILMR